MGVLCQHRFSWLGIEVQNTHQIKIAVSQCQICGDVTRNGLAIRQDIKKASAGGARLVLFPEAVLSGYAKSQIAHPDDFDHIEISAQLNLIQETARACRIWTIVGACHSIEGTNRPYNCQYIISDEGELVDRYDKIYLSHTELADWYTPGERNLTTIVIDDFKFGFAICIEATMPAHFQAIEELDVDCVLYSSMANTALFETLLKGHAAAFCSWIAVSEPKQHDAELRSMIIDPIGEVLAHVHDIENQLVFATLNRADEKYDTQLRLAKPWRRMARQGDIYKSLRVGSKMK